MKLCLVQGYVPSATRDRIDNLRVARRPIPSGSEILREVIDAGLAVLEKQEAGRE
jgi:hypothetical protein